MAGVLFGAYDAGVFRSLTSREFIDFLEALQEMPWSWRNRAREGELNCSANGERQVRLPWKRRERRGSPRFFFTR